MGCVGEGGGGKEERQEGMKDGGGEIRAIKHTRRRGEARGIERYEV